MQIVGPIIKTKYRGPTNSRGSVIVATHKRDKERTWKIIFRYDDSFSEDENHAMAAQKLVDTWPLEAKGKIKASGYDADFRYFVFALEAYE